MTAAGGLGHGVHLRALLHRVWPSCPAGTTSTMEALVLALVIVAAVLAAIELVRSRGLSLACWAIEALALALLVPTLAGL